VGGGGVAGVWSYLREDKFLLPAGGSVTCGILLVRTVLLETPPSYDMQEARGPESDSPTVTCSSVDTRDAPYERLTAAEGHFVSKPSERYSDFF
jgi:hypothetical protein